MLEVHSVQKGASKFTAWVWCHHGMEFVSSQNNVEFVRSHRSQNKVEFVRRL
jgi:hypothetical protein